MKKIIAASVLSCFSCLSFSATPEAEGEGLVTETARGRWSFSAGPAWRSRVKIETEGSLAAPLPTARSTTSRDMDDARNWTNPEKVADPEAGKGGIPEDAKLWGVSDTRTEVYGTAGRGYSVDETDKEHPLGLNLQGCYDFYQGETWSIGLNLRFAGYWHMKSTTRGYYDAGLTRTETWRDAYIFPEESPDAAFAPDADYATIVENGSTLENTVFDTHGSRSVSTRFRGDLYQIALGPKVTWSAFEGWCRPLSWIDLYGGVEAICNIAHSDFRADGRSTSDTDCLVGVGANVGLVGNIVGGLGIYAQAGYEWIDDTDVSAGGFKTDVDYSSLVLSAGLLFRF